MKAAYIEQYGGSDQFKVGELQQPTIGADDVLIEVHAASVNPVDWKLREGYLKEMLHYEMPLVIGWDVSGVIQEVGANVIELKVGDEVFSRPDIARQGTYAEYVAVDAHLVVKKPASLSFEEAASLPLVAHTAWQVMFEVMDAKPGDRIFIGAGSGGVGTVAIQLAKAHGLYVVTSTSTPNVDWIKKLGADEVIDYKQQNPAEIVRDFDFVFDTMGGDGQSKLYQMLKENGMLVSISTPPNEEEAEQAKARAEYVFMQPTGERLKKIAEAVEKNELKPVIDRVFDLEDTKQAHDYGEEGHAKGKIIIKVK
ncbi:NADP-dependent oxidoreductase [Exiguobacterium aestuarii]|uniref:NADP-dependent oxidoreductase n=1 Tax=Exiguobacterium aestuarii TaxID=273527 RepID=A0ABW2PNN3_9BACL|nr:MULTISPECIES: NADP-dependent oxidoreductase [Exiguobacterium]MCT4787517.1 NADP-dependent oxidoreductase [Exiguobacterium aestuarii]